jgi:cytochrome oxidase assembly protein ShyY1
VESGQTGAAPGQIPTAPSGSVTVTAHLLPPEARKPATLPAGQFASIDLDQIQAELGRPLLRAYGVLSHESPAPATAPALLPEPDDGGYWGVNLSYAFQWGLFAIGALAFPFIFLRRRRRLQAEDAAAEAALRDPEAVPVPVPKRKVRIWDEEDG